MKKKYFGTDGIRGEVNKFPITKDFIYKLAIALKLFKAKTKNVLVGKDTRISGSFIENALNNGFKSVNVSCDFMGVASTPMVSFYTKLLKYDFGIMISASHNQFQDNGIKIFKKNGEKLSDFEEFKIEQKYELIKIKPTFLNLPVLYKDSYEKDYKDYIIKKFKNKDISKLKILIDSANGSVYKFAPNFFKYLGCDVVSYSDKPNGKNINKNCGAMFPKRLSALTLKHKVDIGISFDGDADRVIISDEKGNIIDGDNILAIISNYDTRLGKNKPVVNTKMSNLSFRNFMKRSKIKLILSDVGDRYVIEKMKKYKARLGGEPSGHIIFSDNGYCGDGILTAMYIINIFISSGEKLSHFYKGLYKKSYQRLINISTKEDPIKIIKEKEILKIKKEISSKKDLDLLIRKSGTENLLRIMVQSSIKSEVDNSIKRIVQLVKKLDG